MVLSTKRTLDIETPKIRRRGIGKKEKLNIWVSYSCESISGTIFL